MRAFGAEVEVLESERGKVTPELFDRMKARIAELAAEPDTWWAEQFVNPGNARPTGHSRRKSWTNWTAVRRVRHGRWNRRLLLRCRRGAQGAEPAARVASRSSLRPSGTCRAGRSAGTGWRESASGSSRPAPGSTSPTRSPRSPTRTRSRRAGGRASRRASRARHRGPTSSSRGSSLRSSARGGAS